MDTHIFKIYEMHKEEFQIYEGLILSHPLYRVENILKSRFHIKVNYKDNKFNLTHIFNLNYIEAKRELDDILQITNNLGWFPSYMSSMSNQKFKESKFSIEDFEKFITDSFISINFSFEAKYDISEERYPRILYHVCDAIHVDKILKQGLVPRSRSKKAFHPERVYLVKTLDNAYEMGTELNRNNTNKEWAILEIDTATLDYLKLFRDPNYINKGFYTLNNISPFCITLNNILYF
jgi:hypothetical protein